MTDKEKLDAILKFLEKEKDIPHGDKSYPEYEGNADDYAWAQAERSVRWTATCIRDIILERKPGLIEATIRIFDND